MKNLKFKNYIKRIIASVMLICLIMPYTTSFAALGDYYNFRATNFTGGPESTGLYNVDISNTYDDNSYASYRMNSKRLGHEIRTRHIEKKGNTSETIYCLDINNQFPPQSGVAYQQIGNLKDIRMGNIGLARVTDTNKAKLIWFLNNMFIKKENSSTSKIKKEEIIKKVFDGNKSVFMYLTDDDVEFVNQWVIWYFTSNETLDLASLKLELRENVINTNAKSLNLRKTYMQELFSYYITNAKTEINELAKPKITTPQEAILNSNGLTIKPIHISYDKDNLQNILSVKLKDKNGNEIKRENYDIINKAGNVLTGSLYDHINEEIGIVIKKDVENTKEVNLEVIYKEETTVLTVYKPGDKKHQPLVGVTKKVQKKQINVKITVKQEEPKKEYDLALRKSILKVNDKEITGRNSSSNIKTDDLKNDLNVNGTSTTAKYLHAKDPVKVKKGDIVTYKIAIYNETTHDAKAGIVKDLLANGLELADTVQNKKYGWKKEGRSITSEYGKDILIPGMKLKDNKKSIYSLDLYVDLKISDTAKKDQILTNIAYIVKNEFEDRDSVFKEIANLTEEELEKYKGNASNKDDLSDINYFYQGIQDIDDFEKVKVEEEENIIPEDKKYDLALKKFITKVNEKEYDRVPKVNVKPLVEKTKTNAEYTKVLTPVEVKKGDIVTYVIRVYNEGEEKAYVTRVTDFLPEELELVKDNPINIKYGWTQINKNGQKELISEYAKDKILDEFNSTTGKLSYIDFEVVCKVVKESDNLIKNIAEIREFTDKDRKKVEDIDSVPNNGVLTEDDIDTEVLKTKKEVKKEYDLALRKFVKSVNNDDVKPSREPKVDIAPLLAGKNTAVYDHIKTPVVVEEEDFILYDMRVYNEGDEDAICAEVTDYIPEGLEFLPTNSINQKYEWVMLDKDGNETKDSSKAVKITTKYLSKSENVIKAFDKVNKKLDFKDVYAVFKMKNLGGKVSSNVNIAEITKITDKTGKDIKDRDSIPNNGNKDEDDIDREEVVTKAKVYDLALKKYISQINERLLEGNAPKVYLDSLIAGLSNDARYTKEFSEEAVSLGDVIKYTIRVYNEGNRKTYASEIRDTIPEGLVFMPNHQLNKMYGWVMLDKDGNETTDLTKAFEIKTNYLSKEKNKNNVLKPLDKYNKVIDYKDVEAVFVVAKSGLKKDAEIINIAEIFGMTDELGKKTKDRDSIPGNRKDGEDDIDRAKVVLRHFDLKLTKRIEKVDIEFANGKTRQIVTNQTGDEPVKPITKVDIHTWNRPKDIIVKYVIKVTNESKLKGTATEIYDYIPEGMSMIPELNKNWKKVGENIYVNRELENTELGYNESKEVVMYLRWNNDMNNMGEKTNIAEINKDYNKSKVPDFDSVPGNKKFGEDDIDKVTIWFSVGTGTLNTYLTVTLISLSIIFVGIIITMKYLKNDKNIVRL